MHTTNEMSGPAAMTNQPMTNQPMTNQSAERASARTMRASVFRAYGEPSEVIGLGEAARPVAGDDQVLIRVSAANLSIGDHHVVTGKPYLIRLTPFGGLPGPKNPVPGTTVSGVIEEVGANVKELRVGDAVMAEGLGGAYAEYVAIDAARVAPAPTSIPLQDAAAVPWAVTALQGLRDHAKLKAGQRVLIIGASGGVGSWAVQIGKALGAHVTGVCSTRNAERVRELGADEVIDYTKEDFAQGQARFDAIFDLVGGRSLWDYRRVLVPEGTYVSCGGGGGDWIGPIVWLLRVMITSWFTKQTLTSFIVEPNAKDLREIGALVDSGACRPMIERRCTLAEVPAALSAVGSGHARGQTIAVM